IGYSLAIVIDGSGGAPPVIFRPTIHDNSIARVASPGGDRLRVVLLGGRGNFGARIARALQRDSAIELIVASRGPSQAGAGTARVDIVDPNFASELRKLHPGLVMHCVGPFQGQDYRVVRAALAAGAHYVDLADGRLFVGAFAAENDAAARAADRLAIS